MELLMILLSLSKEKTVMFVCPHGGAKSVIAAAYFNRLAHERGLPYVAVSAAAEDPYESVPTPVADFLAREGVDVRSFQPRAVEAEELKRAKKVVTIDCKVAGAESWDDVPKVSEDLPGSAAAIRRHVEKLVGEL